MSASHSPSLPASVRLARKTLKKKKPSPKQSQLTSLRPPRLLLCPSSLYVSFLSSSSCAFIHVTTFDSQQTLWAQDAVGGWRICATGVYNLSPPTFSKENTVFHCLPRCSTDAEVNGFYVICLIWGRKADWRGSVGALECFDFSDLPFLVLSASAATLRRYKTQTGTCKCRTTCLKGSEQCEVLFFFLHFCLLFSNACRVWGLWIYCLLFPFPYENQLADWKVAPDV